MFKLFYAVGNPEKIHSEKSNQSFDVWIVQRLINEQLAVEKPKSNRFTIPLGVDGVCGPKTTAAIEHFQASKVKLRKPDSVIDPRGPSLRMLMEGLSEGKLTEIWNDAAAHAAGLDPGHAQRIKSNSTQSQAKIIPPASVITGTTSIQKPITECVADVECKQSDPMQFITSIYRAAKEASQRTGLSVQIILAQAAQETGWGRKVLKGTNNLFNIKASRDWSGAVKEFSVPEYTKSGKKYYEMAKFRSYPTTEESVRDWADFLIKKGIYAELFTPGVKGVFSKEAQALQRAGYATDPKYAQNLINVGSGPTMRKSIAYASKLHENSSTPNPATSTV